MVGLRGINTPSGFPRDGGLRECRIRASLRGTPPVKPVDLVLFDLDGTLADTVPDIAAALGMTLDEVGVPTPPLSVVKEMVGDGGRKLIERALARASAQGDLDALFARFLANYGANLCVGSRLYPGVPEALERLRRAGVARAVLTNKPGTLARGLLDSLALGGTFLAVIGDGDGFPRKPDPGAARALIDRAGTVGARTAVIGDGLPDARVARAVGALAIAAAWGYVAPDLLRAESPDLVAMTPSEAVAFVLAPNPEASG
jgi:phosphoglycolate phosphatase